MGKNTVGSDLLAQAKRYLTSGDFDDAAKSARAVLALDESNSEASDILKAATAAGEPSVTESEQLAKAELDLVSVEVQTAINFEKFSEAERLIRKYINEFPGIAVAEKILSDVQLAHRNSIMDKRLEQDQTLQRRSAGNDKKKPVIAVLVIGVVLAVIIIIMTGGPPPLDQMEQVNIDEMIQLRKNNVPAAEAYKGKWVTAVGLVQSTKGDSVRVAGLKALDSPLAVDFGLATVFSVFDCRVPSDQIEIASRLHSAQRIKIAGKLNEWHGFLGSETARIEPCELYYP